jgi:hypothetical protein
MLPIPRNKEAVHEELYIAPPCVIAAMFGGFEELEVGFKNNG